MITLKPGKEKSVQNYHPWLFSGAIETVDNSSEARIDRVCDSQKAFLAWGYYDKDSHIPVHLLSWDENARPDENWWAEMIRRSVLRRRDFFSKGRKADTTVFRIIHGEADFLGGLTADVYGTVVRLIISSRLAFSFKDVTVKTIEDLLHPSMIILNTDSSFCAIEKLSEVLEYYKDAVRYYPQEKLDPIRIKENGLIYELIPGSGQKSGFYCDQRDNRSIIEAYCKDAVVMDGCSYTGGFTLHALKGGAARVDAFDSSDDALHMLLTNVNINEEAGNIPKDSRNKVTITRCDIFEQVRAVKRNLYDVIILDPPKLASTKSALAKAQRAYKDLNRVAMEKIKDSGILITCSCSGALSAEDFKMILGWAAKDAGVQCQILRTLSQAPDHPIRISFPESEYLKVFVLRVIK